MVTSSKVPSPELNHSSELKAIAFVPVNWKFSPSQIVASEIGSIIGDGKIVMVRQSISETVQGGLMAKASKHNSTEPFIISLIPG